MDRLDFQRLSVRSFYGQTLHGLDAPDLGPGVNVVYGPNGQGKTTLARALQGALWPASVAAHRPTYEAHFCVGAEPWRVSVDAGEATFLRDGAPSDALVLPDEVYRDRYTLSLSDLLVEDGQSFADEVQRHASGGIDVARAASTLGFSTTVRRQAKEARIAAEAAAQLRRTALEREALRRDEEQLAELAQLADQSAEAARLAVLYGLLADRAARRADADRAAEVVRAFPGVMAYVAEDTQDRSDALRATVAAARQTRAAREQALADARAARVAHGWADLDAPADAHLSAHLRAVASAQHDVAEAARTAAAAAERERRSREVLDPALLPGSVVTAEAFGTVGDYVREAARVRARDAEYAEQITMLKGRLNSIRPLNQNDLRQAIEHLRTWLAYTHEEETRRPPVPVGLVWTGAAVLTLVAVAGAFLWHPAVLLLLLGAAALAAVAVALRAMPDRGSHPARRAQESVEMLQVDLPSAWNVAGVEQFLGKLEGQYLDQTERRVWADRMAEIERKKLGMEADVQAADAKGAEIARALGVSYPRGPEELHLLASHVLTWQDDARGLAAAAAAAERAEAQLGDALAAFNRALAGLPVPPAETAEEAAGRVAQVERALAERDRLADEAARSAAAAEEAAAALAAAEADLAAFAARLAVDPADADAVAALCAQRDDYASAVLAARAADALAADADQKARAHELFADAYLALAPDELDRVRREAQASADRREERLDQAARIRERVSQARHATVLATARATHEAALQRLGGVYDEAADALVGGALAAFVEEETRDQHLPVVFQRAREILADITADRYQLSFDQDTRAFRAIDTVLDRTFALDQLSSGTRVQLLLAVRLAFAEQQEVGVRLPLLLDETLANSDDERAGAIVEAVLRLCREGRQVFYFTAQNEEVAKWRRLAETHPDVDCRFVALPGAAPAAVDLSAAPAHETTRHLPAPDGLDLDAYGDALGVRPWTAWDPVERLPLWYLLDEPADVHACLHRGLEAWGQLDAATSRGAAVPLDASTVARAHRRARAVAAWRDAWLRGRGKRVDRHALEASGAVSGTFLDALAEIADDLDGDAAALLTHLRSGHVKGFRSGKMDELDAYLTEHGYVADTAPLSETEIRHHVAESLGPDADLDDALAVLSRIRGRSEALALVGAAEAVAA